MAHPTLVGVPDERLRPALDAAFAVAVEGRRQRPPVAPPEPLRTYLRFQKPPRSALATLRRVLDDDPEFRARVAAATSPDDLGVHGPALHAWLARADGWESQAAVLGGGEPEHDDPAARREAKRRAAAESVAARHAAELAERREAYEREHVARVAAEAVAEELRQVIAALRTEIDGLQKRARRAEEEAAVHERGLQRAQATVEELRQVVQDTESVRDLALAERARVEDALAAAGIVVLGEGASAEVRTVAPGPATSTRPPEPGKQPTKAPAHDPATRPSGPDRELPAATARAGLSDAAGRAVRQAAASLRDGGVEPAGAVREAAASLRSAAAALEAAAEALVVPVCSPPAPLPPRHHRSSSGHRLRRRPLAMPGGVSASSVDGALHLLRVPDLELVVDGYNVAMLAWPALDLEDRRERCIDAVEDIVRRYGTRALVVFDGSDVAVAVSARRLARVCFSPPGVIADDVIRDVVATLPNEQPVVVATNDRGVLTSVRAMGANTITSETLLAAAGRSVR